MLPVSTKIQLPPAMSAPETAAVMAALGGAEKEPQALFVGGCIRNSILRLPEGDLDIATVHTPDEVMKRLEKAGIKAIPTGIDHGTVTAVINERSFEITTLRRDVETDGRRAVVAFTTDWREDAQRRDFTMNTLLADVEGNIFDPTGEGLVDLERGRVVFVGDPDQRIAEDYLRILRFFRFHLYYGRGEPDPAALAACARAAGKIEKLSRERVTQEFLKILAAENPVPVLSLMFANGVLSSLPDKGYAPEALARLCARQRRHNLDDILPRLALLAGNEGIEKFLILSRAQKADLEFYSAFRAPPSLKIAVYQHGHNRALQAALLLHAKGVLPDAPDIESLARWQPPPFPVGGDDLKKLGVKPGPDMGRILVAVEAWWLEKGFTPDAAACLDKAREIAGIS